MSQNHREILASITDFDQLLAYLRDPMGWPIGTDTLEDLSFEYTADEIGVDAANAAKIQEITRLRPLVAGQPWGIFFVKFERKRLPVVALRRILGQLVFKKRAGANRADRPAWDLHDLLFISAFGEEEDRRICFAHFSEDPYKGNLATLKVLGWDADDTGLKLDHVANLLEEKLAWPEDENDPDAWREQWQTAFTLKHREVITTSKALAVKMAELARSIRMYILDALAIESEKGKLRGLLADFRRSLIHDLDEDGFADMYAQTITYGLLSARVSRQSDGLVAEDPILLAPETNPFLRELLETFLKLGGRSQKTNGHVLDFDELGINEVIETLRKTNMDAVLRDFGDKNPQEDPVIHFYELFLKEYDAKKRMARGVFYTPRPVVSYIVRSVDELLRTEFGLEHGLADTTSWGEMTRRNKDITIPEGVDPKQDFVQILDPATGTGTFLVEVIGHIHQTLRKQWESGKGALPAIRGRKGDPRTAFKTLEDYWNAYVPEHLLTRLHGYELLMAPYAIAHLKIGLKLAETGYRFESHARARVYLTNALEPAQDFSGQFDFAIPALAHEAEAVNQIKRDRRFTVVIGNPPYAGYSANMNDAAQDLVQRYRQVEGNLIKERKLWLQNDYVKFLGLAHGLTLDSGVGSIGYVTDNSYLDGPTFRGVRWNLLSDFSCIDVLNLHGSAKKANTDSAAAADQNVFDITQGVNVLCAIRRGLTVHAKFRIASIIGRREQKYARLLSLALSDESWAVLNPAAPFFLFANGQAEDNDEYRSFISIKSIFQIGSVGVQTSRDNLAIDFTHRELCDKIHDFADPRYSDNAIRERYFPGKKVADYKAGDTRGWELTRARKAIATEKSLEDKIVCISYRPFDIRYIYNSTFLVDWPRPQVSEQMRSGKNVGLCVLRRTENSRTYDYFSVSRYTISNHQVSLKDGTYLFPLYQEVDTGHKELFDASEIRKPNFSQEFVAAFAVALRLPSQGSHGLPENLTPEVILHYTYAVFHSLDYRTRYAALLRIDFPRLPLPGSLQLFRGLIELGGELVALHLMESRKLEESITEYRGPDAPEVGRVGWSGGTVWLDAGKTNAREGHRASKPGTIGFHGVPEAVWDFHIGGYQVCHKWLKDRKGRTLTPDDIAHYHKIVVALHETIRIMQEIDEVINHHGGWPGAFQTGHSGL